jgi:Flp pilus assembly protein TadG
MNIKDQKGASAVEFAIILPVLLLVLFGIIEFSIAFYDKAMITNASREGARAGIVFRASPLTNVEITDIVNNYLSDNLITFSGTSVPDITVTPVDTSTLTMGDPLTVTVSYPYNYYVLPGFVAGLTGSINLNATTVMRME